MNSRWKPRFTYANVMSSIAVFVALGGGAYATHSHLITTQDLRNQAVTTQKIGNGAVTPQKLRNQAVRPIKLARNAIYPAHIRRGSVAPVHIRRDAILPPHIRNGAVLGDKLADGVVNLSKLDVSNVEQAFQPKSELLSGIVTNAGDLVRGRGAESASRPNTGDYRIQFNRNIEECVPVVTPRLTGTSNFATARADAGGTDADTVRVRIWDQDGNADNIGQFNILVLC